MKLFKKVHWHWHCKRWNSRTSLWSHYFNDLYIYTHTHVLYYTLGVDSNSTPKPTQPTGHPPIPTQPAMSQPVPRPLGPRTTAPVTTNRRPDPSQTHDSLLHRRWEKIGCEASREGSYGAALSLAEQEEESRWCLPAPPCTPVSIPIPHTIFLLGVHGCTGLGFHFFSEFFFHLGWWWHADSLVHEQGAATWNLGEPRAPLQTSSPSCFPIFLSLRLFVVIRFKDPVVLDFYGDFWVVHAALHILLRGLALQDMVGNFCFSNGLAPRSFFCYIICAILGVFSSTASSWMSSVICDHFSVSTPWIVSFQFQWDYSSSNSLICTICTETYQWFQEVE
jgi:hypothetical protein